MHHVVNLGDTVQIGTHQIGTHFPQVPPMPHLAPADIMSFLAGRGWTEDSATVDDRFSHVGKGRKGMTWEQAVACEFYEFITLGGR